MSISVSAMGIKCIEATKDGRIFIAGTDGHLWEIVYQAEEGWFTSRTRKVCQTAGFGELILPNWGSSVETIEQIAIDDSRQLIYTLGSKSTIKTFFLNSPTTLSHVITYTFSSVLSHISILSANSPLLDPRNTNIVAITPIQANESGRIYLVAITNSRVRLYIRAIKGYGSSGVTNDPVNSMQVIHVRFPPEQQIGPFSVLPSICSLSNCSRETFNHATFQNYSIQDFSLQLTNQQIHPTQTFYSHPPSILEEFKSYQQFHRPAWNLLNRLHSSQ
jgi:nuclear pore complex protein Nup155